MSYGRSDIEDDPFTPGVVRLIPLEDGTFVVFFIATFQPEPGSTGRFEKVTGGSFVMFATSAPITADELDVLMTGATLEFPYSWEGDGFLKWEN